MQNRYTVQYNRKYLKDLEKIPKRFRQQIEDSIQSLSINPRPTGCKVLKGTNNPPLYRIRSGDYRIVYTIEDKILLILVIKVGHRKEVYQTGF